MLPWPCWIWWLSWGYPGLQPGWRIPSAACEAPGTCGRFHRASWCQKARLRLREDAALTASPQAADVTSLSAFSVREESRKGELACELQRCLGLLSVSTQVPEDQGWRTGVRRRQKADDHPQGTGEEDPVGLRLHGGMLA